MTNITFDEFRPPDFGKGASNEPNHQMVVEWLDALVRYGSIWIFLHTSVYKANCQLYAFISV